MCSCYVAVDDERIMTSPGNAPFIIFDDADIEAALNGYVICISFLIVIDGHPVIG
jgi:hypothetical protein